MCRAPSGGPAQESVGVAEPRRLGGLAAFVHEAVPAAAAVVQDVEGLVVKSRVVRDGVVDRVGTAHALGGDHGNATGTERAGPGRLIPQHTVVLHAYVVRAGRGDAAPGSRRPFGGRARLVVLGDLVVADSEVAGSYRAPTCVERENPDAVAGRAVLLDRHAGRIPHEDSDTAAGRQVLSPPAVRLWRVADVDRRLAAVAGHVVGEP